MKKDILTDIYTSIDSGMDWDIALEQKKLQVVGPMDLMNDDWIFRSNMWIKHIVPSVMAYKNSKRRSRNENI